MDIWKMIFLFNWVIFRFQPFIFQGVGYLTVYDGICLVKVARDLTRPGPPKCSGLEGNPPLFHGNIGW